MDKTLRGATEMTAAMTILGTIGYFVVLSGQAAVDVVFWRCAFGALALLAICTFQGLFRRLFTVRQLAVAALGGVAIVVNWAMVEGVDAPQVRTLAEQIASVVSEECAA